MEKTERRAFMDAHCKQWLSSGLSKSAYCKQHNLVYHQFIWFVGRFDNNQASPGFVKVESGPVKKLPATITLHLRNGNHFTFPEGTPIQYIQQLAQVC